MKRVFCLYWGGAVAIVLWAVFAGAASFGRTQFTAADRVLLAHIAGGFLAAGVFCWTRLFSTPPVGAADREWSEREFECFYCSTSWRHYCSGCEDFTCAKCPCGCERDIDGNVLPPDDDVPTPETFVPGGAKEGR